MKPSNRTALIALLALGGAALVGCPGTDATDAPTEGVDGSTGFDGNTGPGPTPGIDGSTAKDSGADSQEAGPPPCGSNTTLCKDGEKCGGALDCVSKVCRDGICKAAAPADGVKNGDETDIDCGGKSAPACDDMKACLVKDDCKSGVCTGNVCQVPTPTDGVKNGDETDIDCGGAVAPACAVGKGCKVDGDCDNVKCDPVQKKCNPPSHTDGIKNGDETGIDCGGPTAPKCGVGGGCVSNADCNNVACDVGGTNQCLPPSAVDGIKNGTETDIDCGGGAPTNAPGCAPGLVCNGNADCASTVCNYNKKCVEGPSCMNHYGGDTCGRGEVGQAGAAHESCCTSLPLPNNSVRMDKYEITAGRMRTFITAVGGNVQGWVNAHRAETAQIPDNMVQYLPTGNTSPNVNITACAADGTGCATQSRRFGVWDHLGNDVFMKDRPCTNCGQGCWIGTKADQNGHPSYWMPNNVQDQFGSAHRAAMFDQNTLDVKSLNCVTQVMLAAFCAWDGGRLPTFEELGGNNPNSAWGTSTYPWGAATPNDVVPGTPPAKRVQYVADPGYYLVLMSSDYAAAAQYNTTNFNPNYHPGWPNVRYAWPPVAAAGIDQVYLVAGPGRFWNDFRAKPGGGADDGWYDVGGNLLEMTADPSGGPDDANHNSWARVRWVGGSFEGHPLGRENHNLNVMTKYGKAGGRCVRPL